MPIASSAFVTDAHAQVDGRRFVTESHTDDLGSVLVHFYLAAVGTDYAAVMAVHAAQINDQLAEAEANEVLSGT